MNITCEMQAGHSIAQLSGSLDMSAGAQFRGTECIEARNKDLILDLSRVDFMDSAGLAALVLVVRAYKSAGKRCVLAAPTPIVGRILKVTAVHQLAPVEDSVDKAVRLLEER
jgi:anti-sigma B factor antagonist